MTAAATLGGAEQIVSTIERIRSASSLTRKSFSIQSLLTTSPVRAFELCHEPLEDATSLRRGCCALGFLDFIVSGDGDRIGYLVFAFCDHTERRG
jgi:hypothetical protein